MPTEEKIVLKNQEWVPRHQAVTDIEDRGYQFGDGIYEVVRVYDGSVFTMDEHLQRLKRSAEEMSMSLPYDIEEIKRNILTLVAKNKLADGIVYIQVSRGIAARSHGFPGSDTPLQLIAYTKDMQRPAELQRNGAKAVLTEDIRWLRCDIKSINLLGNVLAKEKAAAEQAYEAIQHREGIVTEGSSTNVFAIQDGVLHTHPATNLILNGITRQLVLTLCRSLQLPVQEEPFDTDFLLNADEVFITSTTNEVLPIVRIGDREVGPGVVGPLTAKLQEAFDREIEKTCAAAQSNS